VVAWVEGGAPKVAAAVVRVKAVAVGPRQVVVKEDAKAARLVAPKPAVTGVVVEPVVAAIVSCHRAAAMVAVAGAKVAAEEPWQ
jgi:hypothetical protein